MRQCSYTNSYGHDESSIANGGGRGDTKEDSNNSWDLGGVLIYNPKIAKLLQSTSLGMTTMLSYHGTLGIFDNTNAYASVFPNTCIFNRSSSRYMGSSHICERDCEMLDFKETVDCIQLEVLFHSYETQYAGVDTGVTLVHSVSNSGEYSYHQRVGSNIQGLELQLHLS